MIKFDILPAATKLGWDIFTIAGFIPEFISDYNPKSAKEQIDAAYAHGGGWHEFSGFTKLEDNSIIYPGDPAHPPLAQAQLRDETITIYQHGWVMITQPDGTFSIARID